MSIFDDIASGASALTSLLGGSSSTDPKNDITITSNDQAVSGWKRVRVTRSLDRIPNDFDIEFSDSNPSFTNQVTLAPGHQCTIKAGKDLLLTGYVDTVSPEITPDSHSLRVTGRSMSQDLVDCSAEYAGNQISNTDAIDVATKLCAAYNINVIGNYNLDGFAIPNLPQVNILFGETAAQIIERLCKFSGLLYYDDTDGSLVMARVGSTFASSGLIEGQNVERARATYSMAQRYSSYSAVYQATDLLKEYPQLPPQIATDADVQDLRNRKLILVVEAGLPGYDMATLRANWERNRRIGRSFQLQCTVDSWRDGADKLWTPNNLVPINFPSLKLTNRNYIISEVTYILDEENGHTAQLTLMPPMAFEVEPIALYSGGAIEALPQINPPGGNTNPAAPTLPPSSGSATSPSSSTSTGNSIGDVFGAGAGYDTGGQS
jgi:prophage tail gpP-like protein